MVEAQKVLERLQRVKLSRCCSSPKMDHHGSVRDVHVFSENQQGDVEVSFLAARSIPRLELCDALTGAQMSEVVTSDSSNSPSHTMV